MRIRFKFVKTIYHSGRLAVVFFPGAENSSDPAGHARYVHQEIIDLAKGTQWTFEFPYTSMRAYENVEVKTGTVHLVLLSPIVAPDTCSSNVDAMVEVCMAPGSEFVLPTATKVYAQTEAFPPPPVPRSLASSDLPSGHSFQKARQTAQSNDLPFRKVSLVDNAKVDPCEVHPSMMMGSECGDHAQVNTAAACIGEKLTSVRQLIKRPVFTSTAASGTGDLIYNPWVIASNLVTTQATDWLDIFRPMYIYERGGMEVRMQYSAIIGTRAGMTFDDTTSRLVDPYTLPPMTTEIPGVTGTQSVILPAWQMNPLCTIVYNGQSSIAYSSARQNVVSVNRTSATAVYFARVPRDDYSLHSFVGMPPMIVSAPVSAGFRRGNRDRPLPAINGGAFPLDDYPGSVRGVPANRKQGGPAMAIRVTP